MLPKWFIDSAKAIDCEGHNKLWEVIQEMGTLDYLTCLLGNLYAGQEATDTWNNRLVPNQERSTLRLYIVTCLFNLYAEYIMRNAGLDEAQAGLKIAGRNINNLRYADDTTLMAESEEELKSVLMKVKEENEKVGVKPSTEELMLLNCGVGEDS